MNRLKPLAPLFLFLALPQCAHVTPAPTQTATAVATDIDFGLDLIEFGALVYQIATGSIAPPAPPPDAGPGRHWASVPDAPPSVALPVRDAGSSFAAYRALLTGGADLPPMERCEDIDGADITVGEDFECIQPDGLHLIVCGGLVDGGWGCQSMLPVDGGRAR